MWIIGVLISMLLIGTWYQWRHKRKIDPLLREYHRLQQELLRFKIRIAPPASLASQWQELARKHPNLETLLITYLTRYEELRLHQQQSNEDNRKAAQLLFRSLRKELKNFDV